MTDSTIILDARGITKRYIGVQALNRIDFTLHRGEIACLVGENGSGKSTLVKILAGIEPMDAGALCIDGKSFTSYHNRAAIDCGIQVIYQDLSLFEQMTVAENIAMNRYIKEKKRFIREKETKRIAADALAMLGITLPLDAPVQELSMANKQLIAICRSLASDARILFMDEPTTALTKKEIDRLLKIVLSLKAKGIAIVFISHKLNEVMQICDRVTVLRNGELVGTMQGTEVSEEKLIRMMTGRDVLYPKFHTENVSPRPYLTIDRLTKRPNYENISLELRKGEILGLIGLMGSGRTELALSLFGLNQPDSGRILLDGQEVSVGNPTEAIALGIGLVPEQRATQGLFQTKGIDWNCTSAITSRLKRGMAFDRKQEKTLTTQSIDRYAIKTPSLDTEVRTLSGGNAQKVVMSKWELARSELLILDSPTVGIDIGSKVEIYRIIQENARSGKCATIIISDEVQEIISNCSRIAVMFRGQIIRIFDEAELNAADIAAQIEALIESGTLPAKEGEA